MPQEAKAKAPSAPTPVEVSREIEGSLDTIKEILIGEYSREMQKRLSSFNERVESIEVFLRKELHLIHEEIKKEQDERVYSFDQGLGELKNVTRILDQKLINSNQITSARFSELRDQMLKESHALSEEMLRRFQEILHEIEKVAIGLDNRKPDRDYLANLLVRMANALQAESSSSGNAEISNIKLKPAKKSA